MHNKLDDTYQPQLPSGFRFKKIDSSYLILHPEKPYWALVNEFGFKCLDLFNGSNSITDCAKILTEQYRVDFSTAREDILHFVASLKSSGMLEGKTASGMLQKTIAFTSVFLHVTDACNLHCKHCYATPYHSTTHNLSEYVVLKFLETFYSAGGNSLVLSGGEPLMHKNIRAFFNLNPNATIRLLTNGILLDDDFAKFLEGRDVLIQVSLDGATEAIHDSIRGSGAFNGAMRGITVLKRHGLLEKTNLCTTIMQQNIADARDIIALAHRLGIHHVRFLPVRKRGEASKNWLLLQHQVSAADYKKFYDSIATVALTEYPDMTISIGLSGLAVRRKELSVGNRGCSIGKNLIIDVNGNVYPCVLLMDPQYRLGNIRTDTLETFRSSSILHELVDAVHDRKDKIQSCRQCLWKNFCGGACLGEVHERFGSIWRTDEFCDIRQKLLERNVLLAAAGKGLGAREETECF